MKHIAKKRRAQFAKQTTHSFFGFCRRARDGQAVMATVLFVLFASIAVVGALSSSALTEHRTAFATLTAERAYYLSEAGIEDIVYRIRTGKTYPASETLGLDGATTTVTVSDAGSQKIVRSDGDVFSNIRSVVTALRQGGGASFVYGVQVGRGGVEMGNSSKIIGSMYSNGDISGEGSPEITGDAFAATTSAIDGMTIGGSARAFSIKNGSVGGSATSSTALDTTTVGANAYADTITKSTIGGDAYYQTSISGSKVSGATHPGTPAPGELPEIGFSITDAMLDAWEDDAAAGGTISSPCPYKPSDGAVIGPIKINCDMIIDGSKTVTLAGTVWVAGNVSLKNSARLVLASSYGSNSGILIADNPSNRNSSGTVSVANTSQIIGSGASGSYVLVTSRNTSAESGGDTDAIEVQNSSSAPIYFAPHGSILIKNSVNLVEATAYRFRIQNNSTVTYQSGLANIHFLTGPQGGYSIASWREAE